MFLINNLIQTTIRKQKKIVSIVSYPAKGGNQ